MAKGKGGGLRFDTGKIRLDLLPIEWEWALGDITTKGAIKYDDRNWEKGMPWSKIVGPLRRHLGKFQAGERYDGLKYDKAAGTTGCHHMGMVAWNALALMSYDLRELGENDIHHAQMDILLKVNAELTGV